MKALVLIIALVAGLCVAVSGQTEGAAMVVIYPQDTVVMAGNTALLVCVAYGDPQPSVTWRKGTVSLSNSSQIRIYEQLLNQSGFIFVRSVLEICNTNAAHTGEYSCTTDNGVGNHSISFQLTIPDPAQIVIRPNQTIAVDAGNTITFVCVASGDPNPSISWNRGNTVLNNDSHITIYEELVTENGVIFVQSILELCAQEADAGQYSCSADNTVSNDTASFVLIVNPQYPAQIVIRPNQTIAVDAGNTITFVCVASGDPNLSISWNRGGTALSNNSQITIFEELLTESGATFVRSILELCSAGQADAGQYSCFADNTLGNDTESFVLTVNPQNPAQIVIRPNPIVAVDAGNAVIFVCVAYGDPSPSISWNRGGTALSNNSQITIFEELLTESGATFVRSILVLCSAGQADAGRYSCFADNTVGNDTESFVLTVNPQNPGQIVIRPNPIVAVDAGNTVIFVCVAYGDPSPSISWNRGGTALSNNSQITIFEELLTESGATFVRSILELCSAGQADAGRYSCFADNTVGNDTASFVLTVNPQDPAQIVIRPNQTTAVDAGNSITFVCMAYGDPNPSISWNRRGTALSNNSRITIFEELLTENEATFVWSILELCSAEEADAGQYSCIADNILGNDTASFVLTVNPQYPAQIVIRPNQTTAVDAGNSITFVCMAYGDPNPSISWNRRGTALSNNSRITIFEELLTENEATFVWSILELCSAEEADAGQYSCIADNILGNDTASFVLTVNPQYPAQIVIRPNQTTAVDAGNSITFVCMAYGDPNPSISWNRRGTALSNNSRITIFEELLTENEATFVWSILELCSAEEADAGQYSCIADNILGNDTASFVLTVNPQYPAQIVIRPNQTTAVNAGNSITSVCMAYGDPNPSISWNRGGTALSNNSRITIFEELLTENEATFVWSILELCSAEEADAGQYSCFADNTLGNDTASFVLTVNAQNAAQIVIRPNQTIEVDTGNTITLVCVAYGDPNPSISWSQGDTVLSNNSRITIFEELVTENGVTFLRSILVLCSAEEADGGQYSCFADNTLGNDTASFVLTVNVQRAAMVVIYPRDTVVMTGNTALLACVAFGIPQSSITWSMGTASLSNSSQISIREQLLNQSGFIFVRSVLEICNTNAAHTGEYSCTADNGVGNHSISFQLSLQDAPQIVIRPNQTIVVDAGNSITFVCVAFGDPNPSISWNRGDTVLNNDSHITIYEELMTENGVTFVQSILELCAQEADAGQYNCFADNTVGNDTVSHELLVNARGAAAMVVIYPQNTVVMTGNTAFLVCVAYGQPQSSVTWSMGTASLSNSSQISIREQLLNHNGFIYVRSVLEICNTNAAHTGEYSCTADNGVGNHSISFQLSIQVPAQIVIRSNQTIAVDAGNTINLVCVTYGNPNPSISWNRGDTALSNNSQITIFEELVVENETTFVRSILVLCSTEEVDAGNYSCFADNTVGNDTASFMLTVNAQNPAQIVVSPNQTIAVDAGNTITFVCVASGDPNLSISWNRGGTALSNNSRITIFDELLTENGMTFVQSILTLSSAEEADAEQYSCFADNTLGNDTESFVLTVNAQNPAQIVIRPNQTTAVDAGNSITFVCVASGDPSPSISWNRRDTALNNDSRVTIYEELVTENGVTFMQSILELCNLEEADAGQYSCFADNTIGNDTASFMLTVNTQNPAQIVIRPNQTTAVDPGNTITFVCVASGDPSPSISWNRRDTVLNNNSRVTIYEELVTENGVTFVRSILELCNLEEADAGQYSCFANNTIGNDTASFMLTVNAQNPAQIVIRPNQTVAVDAGNTITFVCVTHGNPNPSISWNREDTVLSNNSRITIFDELLTENGVTFLRSIIELCSAEEADAGQYSCFADNTLGNDTASFVLTVNAQNPAQIVIRPNPIVAVDAGNTVIFVCVAYGDPSPSISWNRGDTALSNISRIALFEEQVTEIGVTFLRSILTLCSAEEADAGQYSCFADNTLGNDTASIVLTVNVQDVSLFQLQLLGVQNCTEWVMTSEANIGIIVESVVNETSRLCQCELTAEQIRDTTLMCSNDSNAVTFRASLVGSEDINSTAILDNTAEWVMNPSSSITVQGRRLSLNPNCDIQISSFTDDSCTAIPIPLPSPTPTDVSLFQLQLLGVQNCTEWVMTSEANIGIIVESVVNETSRLCQCELTAEQIRDTTLMCSNDSNAVTFRASLVGSEANTSTAILNKTAEWVMNPSSSITVQGRTLSLNPNCDLQISSFTDDSCTAIPIPLPSPTPTDVSLFQLQLLGVQNCTEWVMTSEANIGIIVESVVNETSRLCQCELTAEQIRDTTLMCSNDSNAVTFRASLVGSEAINSTAILDDTAEWVMNPSSSITVQGRRLSLNPNCDIRLSSFTDDSCTAIPTPLPSPTPTDVSLFQLQLLGVQNCTEWVMTSEANIGIIVESVVNETSRLCQCELTAEQIRDTTLMCSNDSNAVTFRASLVGSEDINSTAILDNTAEWVMNPSSSITVQGRRLSLNPNCDIQISSFTDDSCTAIPIPLPSPTPTDISLFQLQLLGVQNCTEWVMTSEANIGIIVESVVNETSRLCQCELTAEQICDRTLMCSNDSNAVTFRASLVGGEANTSTAILSKTAEWAMDPSSSITIQGRRLSLNPNCDIRLSSFSDDSCTAIPIPLPSPTPTDVSLFQLQLLGVQNCTEWVVNSEANIGIIVDSVVNETSRLCQCELTAEQIRDTTLMCSNDSNAVTFRASLVGGEANTSTAILSKTTEWAMDPSSSITIQGRRLSLNPNCDIQISSFTDDSCTAIPMPLPSPTPTDVSLFQLQLLGVQNCEEWVMTSETNIGIIVESVVNETSRLCQCELAAEQILDAMLNCSSDRNAVTFRASLVGSQAITSTAFLDIIQQWVMDPSSSITIQGRRLTLNPDCDVHLSSFTDESCAVSTPGHATNVAVIVVPIIVVLLICVIVLVLICVLVIICRRRRKKSYNIVSDDQVKNASVPKEMSQKEGMEDPLVTGADTKEEAL